MRSPRTIIALTAAAGLLAVAGCSADDERRAPEAPGTSTSTATTTSTSTPSPTSPDTSPQSRSAEIVDVDDAGFTPPDGPNARLFTLADGVTQCWMNSLNEDSFLSCRGSFTNAPMVEGPDGQDVPANAVSFTPDGITYQSLAFPDTGYTPATLEPNQRLSAFGYTCTAYSESRLECTGPQGTATIDDGTVTGASEPPRTAARQPTAAPEQQGPQLPPPGQDGEGPTLPF